MTTSIRALHLGPLERKYGWLHYDVLRGTERVGWLSYRQKPGWQAYVNQPGEPMSANAMLGIRTIPGNKAEAFEQVRQAIAMTPAEHVAVARKRANAEEALNLANAQRKMAELVTELGRMMKIGDINTRLILEGAYTHACEAVEAIGEARLSQAAETAKC